MRRSAAAVFSAFVKNGTATNKKDALHNTDF
jgi:hypothetical protein